jgi:hypothetical protein
VCGSSWALLRARSHVGFLGVAFGWQESRRFPLMTCLGCLLVLLRGVGDRLHLGGSNFLLPSLGVIIPWPKNALLLPSLRSSLPVLSVT